MGCGSHKVSPQPKALRVALVGARRSGKSALISCFMEQKFVETYVPTIVPNIGLKAYQFGGSAEVTALELWELVDPRSIPPQLTTVLLALDSTDEPAVQSANLHHFVDSLHLTAFSVVLTKVDLLQGDRSLVEDSARKQLHLSERHKIYTTSAMTQEGVRSLFAEIVRPVLNSAVSGDTASGPL